MENIKKENVFHKIKNDKHLLAWISLVGVTIAIAAGVIYFSTYSNKISIDKAEVSASIIDLGSKTSGILEETFVKEGDDVAADTVVARVGTTLIKTDTAGTIITVKNNIGMLFPAGTPVVSMIQTTELKAVGRLAEDKGLRDVKIGQTAMFQVDAFGGKKYYGTVSEISPTSRQSGVSFSISDKRETKEFEIKIKFDTTAYPELKNGMSAKIWIFKN